MRTIGHFLIWTWQVLSKFWRVLTGFKTRYQTWSVVLIWKFRAWFSPDKYWSRLKTRIGNAFLFYTWTSNFYSLFLPSLYSYLSPRKMAGALPHCWKQHLKVNFLVSQLNWNKTGCSSINWVKFCAIFVLSCFL